MMYGRIFAMAGVLALSMGARAEAFELEVVKVAADTYAIVGELDQRSPDNLGNNATFGAVVTKDGVVLMDPGGSRKGAQAIEAALATVTDKKVALVINTGGQDHRWIGNHYFKEKGARIIASAAAVADQKDRSDMQFQGMRARIGEENFTGTKAVFADETFDTEKTVTFGGKTFHLTHAGQAHTPGDAFVWMPETKTVFTGDIVYVERMLGVGGQSHSKSWIGAFEAMAALAPLHVVPGHGHPTTLAQAKADTLDYLVFLRDEIGKLIAKGGDMQQAGAVDQTSFMHLKVASDIAGRNALQVFSEMEFE